MGSNIENVLVKRGLLSSSNGRVSVFRIGDSQLDEKETMQVMGLLGSGRYVLMRKNGVNILQGVINVENKTSPLSVAILKSIQARYTEEGIRYRPSISVVEYLGGDIIPQILDSFLENSWKTSYPLCIVVENRNQISLRQFIL